MFSVWNILTVFGMGVMFLLVGIIILFVVSAAYHLIAGRERSGESKPGQTPSDTLSKAA